MVLFKVISAGDTGEHDRTEGEQTPHDLGVHERFDFLSLSRTWKNITNDTSDLLPKTTEILCASQRTPATTYNFIFIDSLVALKNK